MNKNCTKCHGEGWYVYSASGTPHSKPCEDCCKHDKGWWLLPKGYTDEGKWCCTSCGLTRDTEPEEKDKYVPAPIPVSTPSPIGWEESFKKDFGDAPLQRKMIRAFKKLLSTEEARIRADEADKCEEHIKNALSQEREKIMEMLQMMHLDKIEPTDPWREGYGNALNSAITRIQEGK